MSKDLVEIIKIFIKHVADCPTCPNCKILAKELLDKLDSIVEELKEVVDQIPSDI